MGTKKRALSRFVVIALALTMTLTNMGFSVYGTIEPVSQPAQEEGYTDPDNGAGTAEAASVEEGETDDPAVEEVDQTGQEAEDQVTAEPDSSNESKAASAKPEAVKPEAAVMPKIPVQADYPGVEAGGALPSDRTFHISYSVSGGGQNYSFDRDVTKTYEEFEGLRDLETGDYVFTLGTPSGSNASQWELVGDNRVTVTLKDDGVFYVQGTDEPFVAKYSNKKVLEFTLHSMDLDGNDLTAEQITSKDRHVAYAFIPESIAVPDISAYMSDVHSQEEMDQALARYRADKDAFNTAVASYIRTVDLTGQDQTLQIAIPSDASDSNRYKLILSPLDDDIASPNMMDAMMAEMYYFGGANVGSDVTWFTNDDFEQYSQLGTLTTEDGTNTLRIHIDVDRQMVAPKLNVKTIAPDADYPLYIKANLQSASDYYSGKSNIAKIRIDSAGQITADFPKEAAVSQNGMYRIEWQLTESDYETPDTDFDPSGTIQTSGYMIVNVDSDGTLSYIDQGQSYPYVLTIKKTEINSLEVPMHTTFAGDYDASEFFPVYVKLRMYNSGGEYTVVKKLETLEDANSVLRLEGQFEADDSEWALEAKFYTDEACTQAHSKWQPNNVPVKINKSNFKLAYAYDASNFEKSGAAVSLNYSRLRVPVTAVVDRPAADTLPAYLRVAAQVSKNGNSRMQYAMATIEGSGDQNVDFDYAVPTGAAINLSSSAVYSDEDATTEAEAWVVEGTVKDYYGYASLRGEINTDGTLVEYGRDPSTDTMRYVPQVLKASWGGVIPQFTVNMIIPEGKEEEAFTATNSRHLHIDMQREVNRNGSIELEWVGNNYWEKSIFYEEDQRTQHLSYENADYPYNRNIYLTPGKYYLYYYMRDYAGAYNLYSGKSDDFSSSPATGQPVWVTEDGSIVDAEGNPYEIDIRYEKGTSKVAPILWIDTELDEDEKFNSHFMLKLEGVEDTPSEGINITRYADAGNSYGTRLYRGVTSYSFFNSSDWKVLPGEYYISYYTSTASAYTTGRYNFYMKDADPNWTSAEKIKVRVDEDANVYIIGDDGQETLISQDNPLPNIKSNALNSVKVKINTTTNEGVSNPFTPGDTVKVGLCVMVTNDWPYTNSYYTYPIAEGELTVTEAGVQEVTLNAIDGQKIYTGDGTNLPDSYYPTVDKDGNPMDLTGNQIRYVISVGTYHSDGTLNSEWSSYNQNYYVAGWSDLDHNPTALVTGDGTVVDPRAVSEGEREYPNMSMKYKWETVPDPDSITQAADGEIAFKPISDLKQIQNNQHYMIVVHNRYDGKWYALSYADGKGDQVLLEDVNSLADLESGYMRKETDLSSTPYIFTAGKVAQADGSANFQFKTGLKDANKKTISLKLGDSAEKYLPVFTNSAGTLTAELTGSESNSGIFRIHKNNYSNLAYIDQFYGKQGFTVDSKNYGTKYIARRGLLYSEQDLDDGETYYNAELLTWRGNTWNYNYDNGYFGKKPAGDTYWKVYEIDDKYLTDEYWEQLKSAIGTSQYDENQVGDYSIDYNGSGYNVTGTAYNYDMYILSDTQTEEEPAADNSDYKLVKTFGDFNNTFLFNESKNKSFVMVYTADDGKQYALNPKGLTEVKTTEGAAEYFTLTCGIDNEVIVNNNSRNWQNETTYNFVISDADGSGNQVIATNYSFRKSRVNTYSGGEYLTMDGNVWGANDKNGEDQLYTLVPTATVRNEVDWDKPTSYKLSASRDGKTVWLGVKEEGGKKVMTVVDNEADAVTFDIYAPNLERYYTDFMSDEYSKYYKISSLADIGADDQIVIVYTDKDGKKRIVSATPPERGYHDVEDSYGYTVKAERTDFPALFVSDEYSTVDTSDDHVTFPEDFRYYYNIATEDAEKKVYAYFADGDKDVIIAQGVTANVIGSEKSIKPTQEKYDSLVGLGNLGANKLWIKADDVGLYSGEKSEVNFFYDNGKFYMRGGKDTYWLGFGTYELRKYNPIYNSSSYAIEANTYYEPHDEFTTVDKSDRVEVEIYKKGGDETIKVNYYDPDDLDGAPVKTETKTEGLIGLPQADDTEKSGEDYIFVGWTKDKSKAGYLNKEDSANLYDFDDISRKAGVTDAAKEKYGLLGNCNPEVASNIKVFAKDLEETGGELDLYPVYALRGRTEVITADEKDGTKVIGVGDIKDLEEGSDGTIEAGERWLGSIDIEVYKDGELWVPKAPSGSAGGASVRPTSLVSSNIVFNANSDDTSATMYFAYHNDDAADVNIKFIADAVTDEMLEDYLRNSDFSAAEPTEMYVIDAVFAEQGGSEDGLKYKYNWVDPVLGGQLDNVRGGSTIKIYITTKYKVKYYYDDDDGNGYEELTDDAHKNDNYYTTPGTEDSVTANRDAADYVVVDKDGADNRELIQRTPSNTQRFIDDNIRRGEYSFFQYEFDNYNHVIPVAELPEAPAGYVLDSDVWTIKDKNMADLDTRAPGGEIQVTGTTYGTGTTVMSYLGKALDDTTNTFHLYIKVHTDMTDVTITKAWNDSDDVDGVRPTADEFKDMIHLMNGEEEVTGYTPVVTDNGDGTYTVKYSDLPGIANDGSSIEYTVKEDSVPEYTAEDGTDTVANGGTLTNIHDAETVDPVVAIAVTKAWDDEGSEDIRPSAEDFAACVTLLRDGEPVEGEVPSVLDNEDGTYTILYDGLSGEDGNGHEYEYTVQETEVPEGYKVDGPDTAEPGGTITNVPSEGGEDGGGDEPDDPVNPDEPDDPVNPSDDPNDSLSPDDGGNGAGNPADAGKGSVFTGDSQELIPSIVVLLLASIALIAMIFRRRQRQ
jgi:hypothetical protein